MLESIILLDNEHGATTNMASLKDLVKAALEKKQAEQGQGKTDLTVDQGKTKPSGQVTSNRPAKKSAGRGR